MDIRSWSHPGLYGNDNAKTKHRSNLTWSVFPKRICDIADKRNIAVNRKSWMVLYLLWTMFFAYCLSVRSDSVRNTFPVKRQFISTLDEAHISVNFVGIDVDQSRQYLSTLYIHIACSMYVRLKQKSKQWSVSEESVTKSTTFVIVSFSIILCKWF